MKISFYEKQYNTVLEKQDILAYIKSEYPDKEVSFVSGKEDYLDERDFLQIGSEDEVLKFLSTLATLTNDDTFNIIIEEFKGEKKMKKAISATGKEYQEYTKKELENMTKAEFQEHADIVDGLEKEEKDSIPAEYITRLDEAYDVIDAREKEEKAKAAEETTTATETPKTPTRPPLNPNEFVKATGEFTDPGKGRATSSAPKKTKQEIQAEKAKAAADYENSMKYLEKHKAVTIALQNLYKITTAWMEKEPINPVIALGGIITASDSRTVVRIKTGVEGEGTPAAGKEALIKTGASKAVNKPYYVQTTDLVLVDSISATPSSVLVHLPAELTSFDFVIDNITSDKVQATLAELLTKILDVPVDQRRSRFSYRLAPAKPYSVAAALGGLIGKGVAYNTSGELIETAADTHLVGRIQKRADVEYAVLKAQKANGKAGNMGNFVIVPKGTYEPVSDRAKHQKLLTTKVYAQLSKDVNKAQEGTSKWSRLSSQSKDYFEGTDENLVLSYEFLSSRSKAIGDSAKDAPKATPRFAELENKPSEKRTINIVELKNGVNSDSYDSTYIQKIVGYDLEAINSVKSLVSTSSRSTGKTSKLSTQVANISFLTGGALKAQRTREL